MMLFLQLFRSIMNTGIYQNLTSHPTTLENHILIAGSCASDPILSYKSWIAGSATKVPTINIIIATPIAIICVTVIKVPAILFIGFVTFESPSLVMISVFFLPFSYLPE